MEGPLTYGILKFFFLWLISEYIPFFSKKRQCSEIGGTYSNNNYRVDPDYRVVEWVGDRLSTPLTDVIVK